MAGRIKKVGYFAMDVANRPGAAARALDALQDVNLLVFTGFPDGRGAQLDCVPQNSRAFRAAAKRAKLTVKPKKTGFLVQGDDRPGAVARITGRLASAKISVTAVDAVCAGKGWYGAILWAKPGDVRKAATTLCVT